MHQSLNTTVFQHRFITIAVLSLKAISSRQPLVERCELEIRGGGGLSGVLQTCSRILMEFGTEIDGLRKK